MKRMCLFSVIALCIFAGASGGAIGTQIPATYFVSEKGNDSGDGSQGRPWKTLQRATNWAGPGDTILATPGNYAGFVLGWGRPRGGGSPGAPITIAGQSGAIINARNSKTQDGIDLEAGCSYIVIKGFTIDNASGEIQRAAIRVCESNHVSVIGNTCQNAGDWGIYASHCDDLLIENNTTSDSKKEHGIYVCNGADRPVIRGNTIFGNANCGIHLNGDLSQGGSGVIRDALIERNIIYDNGRTGGSAINCDGVQHSILRHNLLYGNHSSGISLFREDASEPAKDNLVANNTIIMESNARWAVNIRNASTGNTLRDNILFNRNSSRGSIQISKDSLAGFVSDYNILEDRLAVDDDSQPLASWRQITSQDKASRIAEIKNVFVNADDHDFHLSKSSPAIGAGAKDTPDIGAYASGDGGLR